MEPSDLKPGVIVQGLVLPEPIENVAVTFMGVSIQIVGRGLISGQFHGPILSAEQIALLTASPE